jgi:hypothetical protein
MPAKVQSIDLKDAGLSTIFHCKPKDTLNANHLEGGEGLSLVYDIK